jgi:hypothetical protein
VVKIVKNKDYIIDPGAMFLGLVATVTRRVCEKMNQIVCSPTYFFKINTEIVQLKNSPNNLDSFVIEQLPKVNPISDTLNLVTQ